MVSGRPAGAVMKIISRESRPFNERLVLADIDRAHGLAALLGLEADPRLRKLGYKYLLVEDDYPIYNRLDHLSPR